LVYNAACVCTSLCVGILPATCCVRKLVPSLIGAHPLAFSISKLRENMSCPLTPTLLTSTNPLIATCVHTHFHTWYIVLTQGTSRRTMPSLTPTLLTSTNPLIATCVYTHLLTWHIVFTQNYLSQGNALAHHRTCIFTSVSQPHPLTLALPTTLHRACTRSDATSP
jgi:hypothetical protein